jgi:predicted ATPase/class 3 adenylate cyclase
VRQDLLDGTVTLLLTDIEGSTRLLHNLGAEGYARAQAEHREVLRDAFRANHGVEVDTQGDAFFYVFPSALDALRGSVAAQRGLESFDWSHGSVVKVRMGMHTGEPQRTEEGYVGVPVNTAARIAAVGHGGQVLLSAHTAELLQANLANDEITLRDLGEHRLKDLEGGQRLFQIVIPELASDFPPPRTAQTKPNNLPVPLTPFVGRARLVTQVRDLLMQPACRAATLLGPGGTGKTRLAIRVATELLHNLDDGAFFVSLAPIQDAGLVAGEIAKTLGVPEEPGRPLVESICAQVADKELLLVLDNFEQVQDAAKDVAEILRLCSGMKVLATSRQPLRISGERGVPVPPLALPDPGDLPPLQEVANFEAVRLFVDRAQAARFDFELTEANAADVVEICRRVDALPLAIELATARMYELDTAQLLAALEQRLNVLTEGAVDLLDHQRTLRDLVAWSYDLLEPEEQRLWRSLAVFSGGCELDTAEAVCDPESQFEFETAADDLVAKSLLNLAFESGSAGAVKVISGQAERRRISMLETLREYAAEQLSDSDEEIDLQIRHAAWFLQHAEDVSKRIPELERDDWIAQLDREQANFRAALNRCLNGLHDAETALRLGSALHYYWYQKGMLTEGSEWLEKALGAGKAAPPEHYGSALLSLADFERNMGNVEASLQHNEAALSLFRDNDDEKGVADAARQLGTICQHIGEFERSAELLDEAMAFYRKKDYTEVLSYTLLVSGGGKQLQGDLEGARALYEESLDLARRINDQNYLATALLNLGEVVEMKGETARAAELIREALRLYAEMDVRNAVAYCLELLAAIDSSEGRPHEAAQLFGAADKIREDIGTPVESFNLERYNRDLDAVKAALGEEAFAKSWEDGRAMKIDQAVEIAQLDLA